MLFESESTTENFKWKKAYKEFQAKTPDEKHTIRTKSRKVFASNSNLTPFNQKTLIKANFFKEFEQVFKESYPDYYADNKSLFSKAKPKAKPQAKPKAKPQINTVK